MTRLALASTTLRALWLAIALLAGCSGSGPRYEGPTGTIYVDVVTGLVPGPEFDSVLVQVFEGNDPFDGGARRLEVVEARARFGQDFETGRRVAELTVPARLLGVRVDLVRVDGTILVGRRILVSVPMGSRVVRFQLSRDCVGVECPAPAGSAAYTECVGGQCADPRCEPPDPTYCPDVVFCNMAEECAPVADCSERRCEEGLCQPRARVAPDPAACDADQWCDPTMGCRPLDSMPRDAGGGGDAGTSPLCGTVGCPVANECELGYWECESGTPTCIVVGYRAAGYECNGGLGACDGVGTCTDG